jgi:hypothetical protein
MRVVWLANDISNDEKIWAFLTKFGGQFFLILTILSNIITAQYGHTLTVRKSLALC